MQLHPYPLLPLIYFAFNISLSGIDYFFICLPGVYFISFFYCSVIESPDFRTDRKNNTVEKQPESS